MESEVVKIIHNVASSGVVEWSRGKLSGLVGKLSGLVG